MFFHLVDLIIIKNPKYQSIPVSVEYWDFFSIYFK